MSEIKSINFTCVRCKRPLQSVENALQCAECYATYPVVGGIPDFLSQTRLAPDTLRVAKAMDLLAPIYESRFFVSALLKLSGVSGDARFVDRIADFHIETLKNVSGNILDVACGPATFSRRITSPYRHVYGIDVSMGVLRQGLIYIARDRSPGIRLARARVEELPFGDAVFDGMVCSGSLHLFPDTALSLREIARTMKPGAPLSIQTFVQGNTPVNRLLQKRSWVHSFQLVDLRQYVQEAGFDEFRPHLEGIVLTFNARKAMPRT
jgi:ubiquinone/menaquinone biosynthesis C-methylase UbiE/uncharacterized protein YbaR (Trm112 family)